MQVAAFSERPRRTNSAPVGIVDEVARNLKQIGQVLDGLLLRPIEVRNKINKNTARVSRNVECSQSNPVLVMWRLADQCELLW